MSGSSSNSERFRLEKRADKPIPGSTDAANEGNPLNKVEKGMNVYADLGLKDADEMLVKAQLVVKIAEILRERGWSQQRSAKVLGLTQPKLSKMLRGQFRGISEMKMIDCLIRLGRPVRIVVGPEGQAADERIEVVAA